MTRFWPVIRPVRVLKGEHRLGRQPEQKLASFKVLVPAAPIPAIAREVVAGIEQLPDGDVAERRHAKNAAASISTVRQPSATRRSTFPSGLAVQSVGGPGRALDERHVVFSQGDADRVDRRRRRRDGPTVREVVVARALIAHGRRRDDHVAERDIRDQDPGAAARDERSATSGDQLNWSNWSGALVAAWWVRW